MSYSDGNAFSPLPASQEPVCPRHPDRVAYVRCQRCNRPACPECQRPAAVGVQCVDCVRQAARETPTQRTVFGGHVTTGRPLVTYAIIAICAAVWLGELASLTFATDVAFAPFIGKSEPWRLLTSAFAHDRSFVFHILFNMYALYVVGSYLEPLLGRLRFLALYLISALAGSVTFLLFSSPPADASQIDESNWYTPLVGASGAVFGLFGALLVLNRHLGRASSGLYAVIAINAVIGFVVPGIAWQAHLGGLVAGAACAAVVAYAGRPPKRWVQWLGLGAILALVVLAAVVKYASV